MDILFIRIRDVRMYNFNNSFYGISCNSCICYISGGGRVPFGYNSQRREKRKKMKNKAYE